MPLGNTFKMKKSSYNYKRLFFLVTIICAVYLLSTSFKKIEDKTDIQYIFFNESIVYLANDYNEKGFDLNNDGTNDILLFVDSYINVIKENEEIEIVFDLVNDSNPLLVASNATTINNADMLDNGITQFVKSFSLNELIDSTSSTFTSADYENIYLAFKRIGKDPIETGQFHGKGDKYIGFGFKTSEESPGFHFAWLRVNISADCKTVKVIDAAYQKNINTPIKAGYK